MNILELPLEQNSGAAAMSSSRPLRSQWAQYARYHQSRSNLLLHIVFVPAFLAGNVALPIALFERHWLLAIGAVAVTALSIAIQGRGHRGEPVPPRPFTGALDAIARIFLEQWVTFPRFVLSGGWRQALARRPINGSGP
jgi:Protein of unknown function (DUF962)